MSAPTTRETSFDSHGSRCAATWFEAAVTDQERRDGVVEVVGVLVGQRGERLESDHEAPSRT